MIGRKLSSFVGLCIDFQSRRTQALSPGSRANQDAKTGSVSLALREATAFSAIVCLRPICSFSLELAQRSLRLLQRFLQQPIEGNAVPK